MDAALEITLKAHEISMLVDFLNMTFGELLRVSEDLRTLLLDEYRFSLESQQLPLFLDKFLILFYKVPFELVENCRAP